jgi:hypothetical protein
MHVLELLLAVLVEVLVDSALQGSLDCFDRAFAAGRCTQAILWGCCWRCGGGGLSIQLLSKALRFVSVVFGRLVVWSRRTQVILWGCCWRCGGGGLSIQLLSKALRFVFGVLGWLVVHGMWLHAYMWMTAEATDCAYVTRSYNLILILEGGRMAGLPVAQHMCFTRQTLQTCPSAPCISSTVLP